MRTSHLASVALSATLAIVFAIPAALANPTAVRSSRTAANDIATPARTGVVKEASVGNLLPESSGLNADRRYPQSIGGGALLEVTQGATVAITWFCSIADTYACPNTVTSSWSGSAGPYFHVAFDNGSTVGSAGTTEYFTASQGTPPGVYNGSVCLTSYQSTVLTNCNSFLILVDSSHMAPVPEPSRPIAGQTFKLEIGPAGLSSASGVKIPYLGHLYVQPYIAGVAGKPYEAGPSLAPNGNLDLFTEIYTASPYTDASIDITSSVNNTSLAIAYNTYNSYQNETPTAIPYYLPDMNSNTWAVGFLLHQRIPYSTINSWVTMLQTKSGLQATGYTNGSAILGCFAPYGRIVLVRQPHASVNYGGCTNHKV